MKKANQSQEDTDIENRNYAPTLERPPRLDVRNDHAPNRDPDLKKEQIQKRKDMGGTSVYQKKQKAAQDQDEGSVPSSRAMNGFKPTKENLIKLLRVESKLDISLKFLAQAMTEFYSLKSIDISPDGKLGGRGYIMQVEDIRNRFYTIAELMSAVIDTLYDETRGEHWASQFNQNEDEQTELMIEPEDEVDEGTPLDRVSALLNSFSKK